jgi:hypothetical protein
MELIMGKMSELDLQIRDLIENGYDAESISLILEIPESWVYEVFGEMDEYV